MIRERLVVGLEISATQEGVRDAARRMHAKMRFMNALCLGTNFMINNVTHAEEVFTVQRLSE